MAIMKPAPAPPKRQYSLTEVTKGKLQVSQRIFGFGGEKVGKSTWASGAPGAVFLSPENGTPHLDVERLPVPETWDDTFEVLGLVESAGDRWKTLIIDPVNWLEELAWARVVGGPGKGPTTETRNLIEQHGGGYMKGYEAAVSHWRTLLSYLEKNHYNRGRNVVFLAHAEVKKFKDPVGIEYERYVPAMHHKAAGLIKQWVDDVLYFRHEVLAKQEGSKTLAVATGEHVIHTEWSKAWDAGNRSSLPAELPMSWADYWGAVEEGRHRVPRLRLAIEEMLRGMDAETTAKAKAAMTDDASRLEEILNKLTIKKGENK